MKDPVEVRPPGGDSFLVVLCVEKSRDCAPFTALGDLPLDARDSPGIRPKTSPMRYSNQNVYGWCNSRRQLVDCLAHRVVEVAQSLPVQSPVEGSTDISAGQPQFDVIHPVDHRVLGPFQLAVGQRKLGGDSL